MCYVYMKGNKLCAIPLTQLYALIKTPSCGNQQFIFPLSFYGAQTQIQDSLGRFLS